MDRVQMPKLTTRTKKVVKTYCSLLLLSWALASGEASASIPIRSNSGAVAHWPPNSRFNVRVNESNRSGLSGSDIFSVLSSGLARWKQAARDGFDFVWFQGTDTSKYPVFPNVTNDSEIFFTSQTSGSYQIGCGTLAVTQLYFNQGSGDVTRFDIRINDACTQFTNNPYDTVSGTRFYLGDVTTHELGHAIGLDHSQNLQSTMIYTAATGEARPSCDDAAAMMDTYAPNGRGMTGSISGRVLSPAGNVVFGAHVTAISLERGEALASSITLSDGTFRVGGLEEGTYALQIEPFFPGNSSLGPYYSGINPNVCSGSRFERTFPRILGRLQTWTLGRGGSAHAGDLSVNCSLPGSINGGMEGSQSQAPTIADGSVDEPVATVSAFSGGSHQYFKLKNQSGHIEARVLSHSLWSYADVEVELLNSYGQAIPQSKIADVRTPSGDSFTNRDAAVTAELAGAGDIIVHVTYRGSVPMQNFPSGSLGISTNAYYVLAVSRGLDPAIAVYSTAPGCEMPDSFSGINRGGEPTPIGGNSGGGGNSSQSGACGMIERAGRDAGGSAMRLGNFVLLLAMMAAARRRFVTA